MNNIRVGLYFNLVLHGVLASKYLIPRLCLAISISNTF